jgi:phosphatidylinositol alpha-1,6-mannosyltransferase
VTKHPHLADAGTAPALVLVSELFPPAVGGSAVLLENVYSRLEGVAATVITDRRDGAERGLIRVVQVPMASGQWGVTDLRSLGRHLRVAAQLERECRGRPSVVHCGRALPEGLAALMLRRAWHGPPYLCWTHGEELEYVARSRELSFLLTRVHRGAAAVVANCRNTAERLQSVGVPSGKIHVVYPGVDAQHFTLSRARASIRRRFAADGEILLLTVGRLQRRKGHDLVLAAMDALRARLPHLQYVIVGDGEERARLEGIVASTGLGARVHFVGAVKDEDLPDYYASADIFVHPNRIDAGDVEGFGIVFLEAAAMGLPVIGGRSGGVPEAVEDGVTGLLVSGESPTELAAAIEKLAGSETVRRRLGDAGRLRVERRFTWDRAAREIESIHRLVGEGA